MAECYKTLMTLEELINGRGTIPWELCRDRKASYALAKASHEFFLAGNRLNPAQRLRLATFMAKIPFVCRLVLWAGIQKASSHSFREVELIHVHVEKLVLEAVLETGNSPPRERELVYSYIRFTGEEEQNWLKSNGFI